MTTIDHLLGSEPAARATLTARLAAGSSGSPLLLLCHNEQYAEQVAHALVLALLCAAPRQGPGRAGAPAGCGECPACRKVAKREHRNVWWPEVGARGLPIKEVRALKAQVGLTGRDGAQKVAVIRQATKMLAPAQNALLKVLEEPPAGCQFILTASRLRGLLPTVRSRLEVVRFGSSTRAQAEAAMQQAGVPTELGPFAGSLFGADGASAKAWLEGGALDAYTLLQDVLRRGDDARAIAALVAAWQADEHMGRLCLSLMEAAIIDALVVPHGLGRASLRLPSFAALLQDTSAAQLAAAADAVLGVRANDSPALNAPLALEGIVHLLVQ